MLSQRWTVLTFRISSDWFILWAWSATNTGSRRRCSCRVRGRQQGPKANCKTSACTVGNYFTLFYAEAWLFLKPMRSEAQGQHRLFWSHSTPCQQQLASSSTLCQLTQTTAGCLAGANTPTHTRHCCLELAVPPLQVQARRELCHAYLCPPPKFLIIPPFCLQICSWAELLFLLWAITRTEANTCLFKLHSIWASLKGRWNNLNCFWTSNTSNWMLGNT